MGDLFIKIIIYNALMSSTYAESFSNLISVSFGSTASGGQYGIEKELLNQFPNELKGVKDLTEHQRGEHSYY